jgi:hypothetical protein
MKKIKIAVDVDFDKNNIDIYSNASNPKETALLLIAALKALSEAANIGLQVKDMSDYILNKDGAHLN